MKNFKLFVLQEDCRLIKKELANYLIETNVDVQSLNDGLDILLDWGYNPFKSGFSGAAGAIGGTLGSAFGPLGTMAGAYGGQLAAKGISNLAGKAFQGSAITPAAPVQKQAEEAIDKLIGLMSKSPIKGMSDADYQTMLNKNPATADYINKLKQIKTDFKDADRVVTSADQFRNMMLDKNLDKGGGWAGKLQQTSGNGLLSQGMRSLGAAMSRVPALNQDNGLRRAIAQGMDSVQVWAKSNPKKAALLNMAASGAGALAGYGGMRAMSGAGAGAPQQGHDQIQSGSETAPNAGEYLKNQGGLKSGRVQDLHDFPGDDKIQSHSAMVPNLSDYFPKNQGHDQQQAMPDVDHQGAAPQASQGSWNSALGKHTTSTGPDGQTVYHAQDGQSYVKDNSNLAQRMGLQRWTKVDPNTGQAMSRPSSVTDFMRRPRN